MTFIDAIAKYWRGYADFKTRTSKTTYWWSVLFVILAGMIIQALAPGYDTQEVILGYPYTQHHDSAIYNAWQLATFLPNIALLVRRLRDTNRSGTNAWFLALPIVGWIILLVWTLEKGTPGANNYGDQSA